MRPARNNPYNWTVRRISPKLAWLVGATAIAACSSGWSPPDFALRDDGGNPWSLSQQRGKIVLLTFGFTHCRDTCPLTLAKLARLAGRLHSDSRHVEVAFVTVDPKRDTVAALHRFVARYQPLADGRIVGLTGAPAQIERVEAAYHIWSQPMPHDIAHSAVIYLIDARGRIRGIRDDDDSEASLARLLEAMPSS